MMKYLIGACAAAIVAAGLLSPPNINKDGGLVVAMPMMIGVVASGGGIPLPSYRNTYTDVSNITNYSFAGCDLGPPHAQRLVVCICIADGQSISAVTIDGTSATKVTEVVAGNREISMWQAASTANSTGTIAFTNGAASAGVVHVYALYPTSTTAVDSGNNNGPGTGVTVSGIAKTDKGFTIMGAVWNTGNRGVFTQTGAETVVENYDATYEAASSSSMSSSHVNTATTTTDDYTATITSSSSGLGVVVASWF